MMINNRINEWLDEYIKTNITILCRLVSSFFAFFIICLVNISIKWTLHKRNEDNSKVWRTKVWTINKCYEGRRVNKRDIIKRNHLNKQNSSVYCWRQFSFLEKKKSDNFPTQNIYKNIFVILFNKRRQKATNSLVSVLLCYIYFIAVS